MKLQDITVQQFDPSLKIDQTICPFCNSHDVEEKGHESTLMGFVGNKPEDDPNHVWAPCECRSCKKEFTKQYKSGNVWYASKSRILKGMCNCYEGGIYTCKACGGDVARHWINRDGAKHDQGEFTVIVVGRHGEVWQCQKCGIKTDAEFGDESKAESRKLKSKWSVEATEPLIAIHDISLDSTLAESIGFLFDDHDSDQ